MCIICNLSVKGKEHEGCQLAINFINKFEQASHAMKQATNSMLEVKKFDRNYDNTHKKMVKLMRAWNRLEQEREEDYMKAKQNVF